MIRLTVKELKIPFMNPLFLQTQNEDYGNSDNIKVNPFMNSFFFFICWNSEKCQWLEFRSLRCLCYSLAGPFSTTQKDKNPKLWDFFFFFWARVYIRAFHIGLVRASASRWRLNDNSFLCFDFGLWVFHSMGLKK